MKKSVKDEWQNLFLKIRQNPDIIIGLALAGPIVLLYIFALDSLQNKTTWFLGTITAIIVFFIAALSLDLEVGSMGLPNFGKVAFIAIGANLSALLYSEYHVNFFVGVIITLFVSALLGFIISIPTVKLRADYFAIMTIAGGEIIRMILQNEKRWLWTTSADGTKSQVITNILRIEFQLSSPFDQKLSQFLGITILEDIGSSIIDSSQIFNIPVLGLDLLSGVVSLFGSIIKDLGSVFLWEIGFLLIFSFFALLVFWFIEQIRKSPYGRTLRAIREDDISVTSVGKDVGRFRWQVTTLSALICGLSGILFGLTFSSFEAGEFRPFITFNLYIFIIIGGLGNSRGAFIGTTLTTMFTRAMTTQGVKDLITPINDLFEPENPLFGPLSKLLRVDLVIDPEVAAIVLLGMILILFLLFKPAGLIPEPKTDTEKYLSLLTPEERARSDAAVLARQSLSEKERLLDTSQEELPP
jgi:branched-chain amino acid transport system permease protein